MCTMYNEEVADLPQQFKLKSNVKLIAVFQ
jgi:hypothetical protein